MKFSEFTDDCNFHSHKLREKEKKIAFPNTQKRKGSIFFSPSLSLSRFLSVCLCVCEFCVTVSKQCCFFIRVKKTRNGREREREREREKGFEQCHLHLLRLLSTTVQSPIFSYFSVKIAMRKLRISIKNSVLSLFTLFLSPSAFLSLGVLHKRHEKKIMNILANTAK